MWPTIQSLLTSSTSTDSMRAAVLWIIGTAVQNNPSAQSAVSTILRHVSILVLICVFSICLYRNLL